MRQTGSASTTLDDLFQKTILCLEQGRERIGALAETCRREHDDIAGDIDAVRSAHRANQEQLAATAEPSRAAEAELDSLLGAGAAPDTVRQAIERAMALRVDAALVRERERWLQARLDALQTRAHHILAISENAARVGQELSSSIQALAESFRQVGSTLESAQQSRALGLHAIRVQEEERRRLAREIHDGPTQLLNSVVLRIDVCQRLFDTDVQRVQGELLQLKELVRLSLQDVRKIIFDLRPMTLDDLGLVPALRAFLKDYQAKTGIETDFTFFGNDRRYDPAFEIALFRIVQEALNNTFKHAGASRVWVKVETTGGREIKLTVRDDGAGFDPATVKPGAGGAKFGLVAMKERAELLGGSLEIQSAPGQGTRLNFVFPLLD